jgi:FG-GAP-like repeat
LPSGSWRHKAIKADMSCFFQEPYCMSLVFFILLSSVLNDAPEDESRPSPPLRWLVRVDPIDLDRRAGDEMPAEVELDVGDERAIDVTTLRIVRVDQSGKALSSAAASNENESIPFRWYDASIPHDFPEFHDSVSRTSGVLLPAPRERGGDYLNAMGDCRKGRLAWLHSQVGNQAAWYSIEARLLPPGKTPRRLPARYWIGDGQARCAKTATQAVQSDHLRLDLTDWNGDSLVDLITGDDFGHIVWWPNLGARQSPVFEYCRLLPDADGQPIDVGSGAAPKVCDWDADGDLDLLAGTERNRVVWFENIGTDAKRRLKYRGFVLVEGKPLELPVAPLARGEPAIYTLDYYPVLEFVDWDGDGDNDLLAGGYITGRVFLYENSGRGPDRVPKLIPRGPLEADGRPLNVEHWGAAPCAVDLDGDGDLDLLSGHMPIDAPEIKAGIRYFENIGSKTVPRLKTSELKSERLWSIVLGSPRAFDWDDDGDFDLVISVRTQLLLLENSGSRTAPKFDKPGIAILPHWGPAPVIADQLLDWNSDGRVDLVSGLSVRLNSGEGNPWEWPEYVNLLPAGTVIQHPSGRGDDEHSTLLDDFDHDGAIDILFGDWFGHVWLHRNRGTSRKPDFDISGVKLSTRDGGAIKVGPIGLNPEENFDALQGARTVIAAGDFDGDSHRDLIVGDTFGKVRFFRQIARNGRPEGHVPVFAPAVEIGDLGIRLNVCATDWNQDGRTDIIAGSANGKVRIFLNESNADRSVPAERDSPFSPGFTPTLPAIMQPRVLLGDLNGDGDDDLYFPSTQGACFVERSFLKHGYARGVIEKFDRR